MDRGKIQKQGYTDNVIGATEQGTRARVQDIRAEAWTHKQGRIGQEHRSKNIDARRS